MAMVRPKTGVRAHVGIEHFLPSISPAAHGTSETLHPRVTQRVAKKVRFLAESGGTQPALMRPYSCVRAMVGDEFSFSREFLVTHRASVRFFARVYHEVRPHSRPAFEKLLAHAALA